MPKKIDSAEQRRVITQAAINVINDAGLDGTRLRDVARAGNMTTGAVTHYFDNKDAVVEAALEEIVRRTLKRMEPGRTTDTPAGLNTFITRVCRYLPVDNESRQEWRVWLAFWGRAIADERLRTVHQNYYQSFVSRLTGYLQPLAPLASAQQTARCADALIAAIDGIGTRATLEPESWPPKRQRETLTALLLPLLSTFSRAGNAGSNQTGTDQDA